MTPSVRRPGTPVADDTLEEAVRQLLADPNTVDAAALSLLRRAITSYLYHRGVGEDAEDIAQETLEGLLRWLESADHRAHTDELSNPVGYVLNAARNTAVNQWRARQRRPDAPVSYDLDPDAYPVPASDDEITQLLDRQATAALVRAAMVAAVRQGDKTAVQVVQYIFDAIEAEGIAPSNRVVAEALGLSHTGVAKALARFRGYLKQSSAECDKAR